MTEEQITERNVRKILKGYGIDPNKYAPRKLQTSAAIERCPKCNKFKIQHSDAQNSVHRIKQCGCDEIFNLLR